MIAHAWHWVAALAATLAFAPLPAGAEQVWRGDRFAGQHFTKVRSGGHGHGHHHHGHRHFRSHFFIGFGLPLFSPWYEPAYRYPRTVVVPAAPPVYVERGAGPGAAPSDYAWYYCSSSRAYYPYVPTCSVPWKRVAPTPPGTP